MSNRSAAIVVEPTSPRAAEARELIFELDAYLNGLYPLERNYLLDVESLCAPEVTFLLARCDGTAAGCGALRRLDESRVEIKRMYVRPHFRGLGIGRAVLEALERHAVALGAHVLLLETGTEQPEALTLYERHGYERRGRYGEYRDDPTSLFFEKRM